MWEIDKAAKWDSRKKKNSVGDSLSILDKVCDSFVTHTKEDAASSQDISLIALLIKRFSSKNCVRFRYK